MWLSQLGDWGMCIALDRLVDRWRSLVEMDAVSTAYQFEPGVLGEYALDIFECASRHGIDLRTKVDDAEYQLMLRNAFQGAECSDELAFRFVYLIVGTKQDELTELDQSYLATIAARNSRYLAEHTVAA